MILPVEIIENILKKCDGNTLLTAKKVCDEWNSIVEYLTVHTRIWEWCCKEEIPKNELIEYLQKFDKNDREHWLGIYVNWSNWEKIDDIRCDIIHSPVEGTKITCMAISGDDLIALGSEDGRVRVLNRNWNMVHYGRHLAVRITSVTFIESGKHRPGEFCLAVAYHRGLLILCYEDGIVEQLPIQDVKSHSIYQNYICYEKIGGRMTICQLIVEDHKQQLVELWFSRIYSPNCLSSVNMWDGVCTFLINNEVKVVHYNSENITPMEQMKKKTRVKYSFHSEDSYCTQIIRNDILITLYRNDDSTKGQFLEFFLLGENSQYSKKLFNTWEIFKCSITCIYVYGNTLLLGVDIGIVFFYHVSKWKNLDLREYNKKIIIGKHPVVCINVRELKNERRYYVSTKFNVHEISGISPLNCI